MTIAYLINRCPSTTLGKNHLKKFGRVILDLDKFRIFGCGAYAHIRPNKVEPRVLRYMFIGYLDGVKAYRLCFLEPSHKRCIISHNVFFNEAEMTRKLMMVVEMKKL